MKSEKAKNRYKNKKAQVANAAVPNESNQRGLNEDAQKQRTNTDTNTGLETEDADDTLKEGKEHAYELEEEEEEREKRRKVDEVNPDVNTEDGKVN
jgi:hypothetical protein